MASIIAELITIGLSLLAPATGGAVSVNDAVTEAPRCDDGSPSYYRDGSPNFNCSIDGCHFGEQVCWSERLDHCYDGEGNDNGTCDTKVEECKGLWDCFKSWLNCPGEHECSEGGVLGCEQGTCTTDEST